MTSGLEIALVIGIVSLDLRWDMVFGHLSPIGVVSPIVVAAPQCGSGTFSSSLSTVLASRRPDAALYRLVVAS
jgi:hypothetical protein